MPEPRPAASRRELQRLYDRLAEGDAPARQAVLAALLATLAHAGRLELRQSALNTVLRAVNNGLAAADEVREAWRAAAVPLPRLRELKGLPALERLLGLPLAGRDAPFARLRAGLALGAGLLAGLLALAVARGGWPAVAAAVLVFNQIVLAYFVLLNLVYLVMLAVAIRELFLYMRKVLSYDYGQALQSDFTPPISLLVPAYNEERTIVESVRSFLMLHYPQFEVVVINDGSTDRTLDRLREAFGLVPTRDIYHRELPTALVRGIWRSERYEHLVVLDKVNGGKSDALNAGLNMARYPLVCAIDADSLLDESALLQIARAYLEDPFRTVAVGGIVRIANGCDVERGRVRRIGLPRTPLAMFQVIEYLRAFLIGRIAWSAAGLLMIVSGAFGLFKKDLVLAAGGYRTDTVGEDMELVVRLHRYCRTAGRPYRVVFIPDPVCWTEAPESLGALRRQRSRWQRGLLETLWTHRHVLFNRRYGRVGWVALPYFVLFELLGPVIEVTGYGVVALSYALGLVDTRFALLFLLLAVGWGILLSVGALLLEEISFRKYSTLANVGRLVAYSVLENVGYRQLTAFFRLVGVWQFLRGRRQWGDMRRLGFRTAAARPLRSGS
ncbi:MAG TPA: glycosyltransferase family 2 protein [Thermodesulfobacteriota bacterium]|nr:glycosyltransferase family 2 protein [Thermodesulfobacteriota bacterium]